MEKGQLPIDWNRVDIPAARAAREKGIERAERSAGDWQIDALAAIRAVAQRQETLTTDDVWRELGRDPRLEGRAMGAAMRHAAKLGVVEKTSQTRKSARVACHRRDLRVWHSLRFKRVSS